MMYIYAHVFIAIDLYVRAIFEITTLFIITENNSLKIESKLLLYVVDLSLPVHDAHL